MIKNLRYLCTFLLLWVAGVGLAQNVAKIGTTEYATLQEAFNAAQDGETVTLLRNVDATGAMYSGDNRFNLWVKCGITVDGTENNYTITVKGRGIGVQGASESNKINVTFKNVTIKNVGNVNGRCIDTRGNLNSLTLNNVTLTTEESSYTGYLQPLTIGGDQSTTTTVNITNSNLITVDNAKKGYAITTFNPVNMTIDESTLKGWACLNIKAADNSAGSEGSTITVTNSTLVSANGTPGYSNSYSLIKIEDDNINVNITGSTVNVNGGDNTQSIVSFQKIDLSSSANCTVSIGDGNNVTLAGDYNYSSSEGETSKLVISGGIFNKPVPEENCAEGYIPTDLGNGKYSVKVGQYVAQIVGGAKYETLQAAINAAADGNTVTLLTDINMGATAVNINKGITLDGDGYTITSTANAAVEVSGTGNVTISDTKINATNGRGVQVGNVAHYSGQLTINEGTVITVAKRGINILDVDEGFALNVDGSIIQTNVADPTTTYTTGDDSRGINFSNDPLAFTANITNSEIRGFSYCTNIYSGTANLTLNITGGKTYGRDVVNNWGKNNTFNLDGVEVHGLNNQTGPTEAFACIVENTGSANNNYNINNCQFISTLSEAAQNAANSSASEYMIDLRGNNTKVVITGTTTYTTNAPEKGGFIEYEPYIDNNTIMMDETAANTFANAFKDYKVVSTNEEPGYIVNKKNYVAQIGEGESAKKYESLEAAWAEVQDGETITLLKDCAGNGIKTKKEGAFTEGVTIDFKGFTYTMDGAMVGSTGTQTQAFQLLKDNKITFKNGTIYSEKALMLIQNYSNLTLEGMTLTLNNENYNDGYTLSNNNGNIVIDGTTINANPAGSTAFDVCRYSDYTSVKVTVKGESVINGDIEVDAGAGNPKDGMFLTVEAGTINGNLRLTDGGATAITDNAEKAAVKKSNDVTLAAPADYKWKDNGDGTSTLAPCVYVAQIGETKYESLADAVAAVPTNGTETTITMIADANPVGINGATIATTQNVKLDLNGKTITLNIDQAKASQLITNRGTLTIVDSSEEQTGKLTNTAAEGVSVGNWPEINFATNIITNSGTLNMEEGTVQNTAAGSICYAVDNNTTSYDAILNMKGGLLTAKGTAVRQFCNSTTKQNVINMTGGTVVSETDDAIWTQLPGSSATSKKLATLNISGGELTGVSYAWDDYSFGDSFEAVEYSITGGKFTGPLKSNAVINGVKPGFISGGVFDVAVAEINCAEGYIPAANTDEATKEAYPYTVKTGAYVAQIGDVKYESLKDAVAAAGAEETVITLLKDVEENVAVSGGKNIVLDLGEKTLTGYIDLYDSELNVKNGNVAGTVYVNGGPASAESGYNKFTLAADAAINADWGFILYQGPNGNDAYGSVIDINGTVNGTAWVMGNITEGNSVINVNSGAKIEGSVFGLNGLATLNVKEGATIIGSETGIEVRAGNLNVEGGNITSTSEVYTITPSGSGTTTYGAAIAVAQHTTGLPINANITGGTLSGLKTISVADPQGLNYAGVVVTAKDALANAETVVIPEGYKWVSSEGMSTLTPCTYVAQIGDTQYETLKDAIAAVPTDGSETTITMIANEMINVVGSAITIPANKNVVIDLNGFQVVGTAEGGSTSALITNKGTLTIKDSSDTNKDGTGTGKLISGATTTWIYDGGDDYSGSYASNTITNSGTLTIESGYIENISTGSAVYAVDNNSTIGNATLNVKGGVLTAVGTAVRQFCNSTTNENNVNISGGEVVTNGSAALWVQLPNSDATKAPKATLNVTGGTLSGNTYAFYDYSYGNSFDATQYNLSGGTFNGGIFSYGANITISDGEYNSWIAIKQAKPSNVAVTGGKFADDVYTYGANASEGFITGGVFASTTYENEGNTYNYRWLNCLADGYVPAENTDPETMEAYPYAVRQANYICAIGETKYETLQDAINACEAGTETTIKLLDNVTDGAGFAIPDGVTNKNIIIDFDGKSYNVTKGAVGSTGTTTQAMHFYSGNTLTLKNGTITSAATSEENKLKMMMQNYCDLTLDGMTIDCSNINGGTYGTFTGADAYWSNKSVPVFNFNTGNATIKNTTITFRDGDNMGLCVDGGTVALGEGVVVNGPVSAVTGTLTITDGKYSGAVTADQATVQISGGVFTVKPADEYCAQGYVVTDNTDEATKDQYPFTVKSNEEAGIYELIDGVPYPESLRANGGHANKVTYTRTFGSNHVNKYQAWYVPFNYTITEDDLKKFTFYKIHMMAASTTPGVIEDKDKVFINLVAMSSGDVLKAEHVYMIKPHSEIEYVFTAEDVDLSPEPNDPLRVKHLETSDFEYDYYGTYVGVQATKPHDMMYMAGGQICWNASAAAKLGSYRWYIKVTAKTNTDAKPYIIFIEGDGDTDGINNAQVMDGEIEGIYTLGGMKVEHPVKGVNIIKYTDGRTKKINVK